MPGEVRFDARKWRLVDRIKLEEDQNRQDLMTDRVVADTFRAMFMKYNKPWMQEQMYEIFTPRTLFLYRKDIVDQFQNVLGEIEPDLTLTSEGSGESKGDESLFESDELEDKSKKKRRFVATKDEQNWVKINDTPITRAIIKYWVFRARFKQKLRIQVSKLIESQAQRQCLYCQASYGLKVELI